MENYEVLHDIGAGAFGQVFKAKRRVNGETVAYKVVRKTGRSPEELVSFRKECEIQRCLCHPNIVKMLDSFETESQIVVVSEYAEKSLDELLVEHRKLSEERAQVIACDLVSALYYLHSNRVLHRDLKPQNILLDAHGIAKLCDFGFACVMGKETDVLTSIKGTPLYMAPELIEEYPYDHNADLWSLGCIIYELVMGFPPFATASIVHLIHLIRHESIKWPDCISSSCQTFLQGLLQKDCSQRLTWPNLLKHPFVKNRILIVEENMPVLMKKLFSATHYGANSLQDKNFDKTDSQIYTNDIMSDGNSSNSNVKANNNALYVNQIDVFDLKSQFNNDELYANFPIEDKQETNIYENTTLFDFVEEHPIENDEWIAFLQNSMEEIMEGEINSLLQENCVSVFISPLKNTAASCRVTQYISSLLSLPFVVPLKNKDMENILKTYVDTSVVPNLIYALLNLFVSNESKQEHSLKSPKKSESNIGLSIDQLQALESMIVLMSRLVYTKDEFVKQFCDTIQVKDRVRIFYTILHLEKKKSRIIANLIAIFIRLIRTGIENMKVVEKVLLEYQPKDLFTFLMSHQKSALRSRTCVLVYLLGVNYSKVLRRIWGQSLRDAIEALLNDSNDLVKKTAEEVIVELRQLYYFDQETESS
ncbi:serine/threonine-protein kinase fused [Copidosoma floridanum]|uniref:serine/threonine-protein kinase fused n=1 Tax=Copidosoma floridanum TaxID=29053 RepID=UPI000C6F7212|nr:serine/threonine-protein kinase fused [Copidosoma floridanum]